MNHFFKEPIAAARVEDIPKSNGSGSLTSPEADSSETTSGSELSEEERKRLERLEKAQKMKLAIQVWSFNLFWLSNSFFNVIVFVSGKWLMKL